MDVVHQVKRRWSEDGPVSETTSSFLTVSLEDGAPAGWVTWRPTGNFSTYEIGIALFPEQRRLGITTQMGDRVSRRYLSVLRVGQREHKPTQRRDANDADPDDNPPSSSTLKMIPTTTLPAGPTAV